MKPLRFAMPRTASAADNFSNAHQMGGVGWT
jgi:hypothetical protein